MNRGIRRALWRACMLSIIWMPFAASARAQEPAQISEAKRLRDVGRYTAAVRELDAWLERYPGDAGVHWLRAQILHLAGDYTAARHAYDRTLSLTPNDPVLRTDIARFTDAVARATSPWVRTAGGYSSDDQPLRAASLDAEAGVFISPLVTMSASGRLERFVNDFNGGASRRIAAASIAGSWSHIGARLTLRGNGGIENTDGVGNLATGRAVAALSVASGTILRAGIERRVYHSTLASFDTTLAVRALEVALDRANAPGLGGVAALRSERFPDGTDVRSAFAWVLVPVVPGVRAGIASAWQDATDSRWNGVRYDPFYTPENVTAHSVLGELRIGTIRRLQLNGSYGVKANEDAPVRTGQVVRYERRDFTPWSGSAVLALPFGSRTTVSLRADHQRTSFYHATRATATVLWLAR